MYKFKKSLFIDSLCVKSLRVNHPYRFIRRRLIGKRENLQENKKFTRELKNLKNANRPKNKGESKG
ncbi:hypothetical protein [Helicobacter sp. MIT 14-3879]|uniref:hypothetical protein n=1 Tax=Helicobacter sp. MIT 14-3879 TaxID=2040649 RepID=UPI0011C07C95|nr:hypothetical protein [Helicobacter sp. MIT 14-3879]